MSIFHLAVADDDVSGWLVPKSAIVVAATLDGDTVVTGMEEAVLVYMEAIKNLLAI